MLQPTAGIVFPLQSLGHRMKGAGNVGGWDLEQWLAVEGLLLLGGCVGGQWSETESCF